MGFSQRSVTLAQSINCVNESLWVKPSYNRINKAISSRTVQTPKLQSNQVPPLFHWLFHHIVEEQYRKHNVHNNRQLFKNAESLLLITKQDQEFVCVPVKCMITKLPPCYKRQKNKLGTNMKVGILISIFLFGDLNSTTELNSETNWASRIQFQTSINSYFKVKFKLCFNTLRTVNVLPLCCSTVKHVI